MLTNPPAAGLRRQGVRPVVTERQRLWLAALTGLACLATVALLLRMPLHAREQRIDLAVLACVPVTAFGRRWPLPVLGLATAAAAAQLASGRSSLPLSLMLGLAGYWVAAGVPRRWSVRSVVAAAAALGLALAWAGMMIRAAPVVVEGVEGFVPLVAAWFVGDSAAARRRYLAGLAEQAEREREAEAERARQEVREERVRIARELHDVVAHTLAVITVQAGVGRRLMAKRPQEASTALETIEMIGRTAQDELRVVLGLLRDEETGAAALAPAPRLADLKELADTVRALGDARRAAHVGHRSSAIPGARAHGLPGRPGGAHQRRPARAGSACDGRPRGPRHRGPPRGDRRRRVVRASGGRSGAAGHPGHGPRDRRDTGADMRFRRLARRRAARRRRLSRARRGSGPGRTVSGARAARRGRRA